MRPCGKAVESRAHIVGECEIHKEERDALEEMRKMDECDMEKFGTRDSSEKSAQMLEASLLRVLRIEGDAWSMVKCLRQATNEHASTRPRMLKHDEQ